SLEPATLEFAGQRLVLAPKPPAVVEQCLRALAGSPGERDVGLVLEGSDPEARQPGLGEAEHVTFAPQLEVALGELEAVADLGHRLQASLGGLVGRVGDEDAERLDPAPA